MTDVLVILDGASEPVVDDEPTSLERADTPVLDALAAAGTVRRLRTIPAGLPAGSETGIAVLLGWTPSAPVDRAALEAAALDLEIPAGHEAWRVDAPGRGDAGALRFPPEVAVHLLGAHKVLAVVPAGYPLQAEHVWPRGVTPPRVLDGDTVFIATGGAGIGLARLLGARAITTGALATAAVTELLAGAARVVVHVQDADEAAHDRDPDANAEALTRADEDVLFPIAAAIHQHGGTLTVTADHGTDPRTGEHDAAPVPAVVWDPEASAGEELPDDEDLPVLAMPKRRATAGATAGRRVTERWVATLPVEEP